MNIFVFDIETVPDTINGARLYDLKDLSEADIAQAMFKLRREESGTDFLRLHLQRIVAISVVLRSNDTLKVWSLGEPHSTEQELLERFFTGIEKYTPTLISWNGCAFDLPVIQYRALLHGVSSPLYWETGDSEQTFRWNNYLNRYHYRHMDLMDILSAYQPRAYARLDEIALMLGFPGKMGISGKLVWDYFQRGEIETIRNYCETDVLNTYLIYLRFELMRGRFNQKQYANECDRLRDNLQKENKPHFTEFLNKW